MEMRDWIGQNVYVPKHKKWGRVVGYNGNTLVIQTRGGNEWSPDDEYVEALASRVEPC